MRLVKRGFADCRKWLACVNYTSAWLSG